MNTDKALKATHDPMVYATPRVSACIEAVMRRFPSDKSTAYFEAVHQELAPLAREMEHEIGKLRAALAAGDERWSVMDKVNMEIIAERDAARAQLAALKSKPLALHGEAASLDAVGLQWMRVEGDHLYISRSNWIYPQATEDVAGPRDEARYNAIGRRDGDMVLHFRGAWLDAQDLTTMLTHRQTAMKGGAA